MKTAAGYKHHQQHNFYEGELAEEYVVEALVMLLLAVVGQLVSRESDKMEVRRSERRPRKKQNILLTLHYYYYTHTIQKRY